MNNQSKRNIDEMLTYLFLKRLMTPFTKTDAYKLGLINSSGRVIKNPSNEIERTALTTFDKIIFKLKRLMGGKLINFNKFLWLTTTSEDMLNRIVVRGTMEQRADIQRIQKDIDNIIG